MSTESFQVFHLPGASIIGPLGPLPLVRFGNIWLRPWELSDVDALHRAGDDEEVAKFVDTVEIPFTKMAAESRIRRSWSDWIEGKGGHLAMVKVAENGSEQLLGSVGFDHIYLDRNDAEICGFLGPQARAQGYAGPGLKLICYWGFAFLGFQRMHGYIRPDNIKSRVATQKRAGLRLVGTVTFEDGEWVEYEIMRPEYLGGAGTVVCPPALHASEHTASAATVGSEYNDSHDGSSRSRAAAAASPMGVESPSEVVRRLSAARELLPAAVIPPSPVLAQPPISKL